MSSAPIKPIGSALTKCAPSTSRATTVSSSRWDRIDSRGYGFVPLPDDDHGGLMKYRALADTGVFVSELCLGTMTFGGKGQIWETIGGMNQAEVDAMVGRSLDAGINFIDTADVYSSGESETLTGKALKGRRHEVVLATRFGGAWARDRTTWGSRGFISWNRSRRA